MLKVINKYSLNLCAAAIVGMTMASDQAHAQPAGGAGGANGNDFSSIAENITNSIASIPGLVTGVSYMLGILLGVLGILKIKDHVEQPTSIKLSEGAIRLVAGGGLFALPIIFEAMQSSIGDGTAVTAAELNKVQFNVK